MNAPARAVRATVVPEGTFIHNTLKGADFFDAYTTADPQPHASALQTWLAVVARTPAWAQHLLAVRNRLVRLVGLKGVGQLHDAHPLGSGGPADDARSYRVGDRVGIFVIRQLSDAEVVMGQDDKHLDVQVSLAKLPRSARHPDGGEADGVPGVTDGAVARVVVSTVVHIHNPLGHAYMAVITPFHRLIVQAMLRRLSTSAQPGHRQQPQHGQR